MAGPAKSSRKQVVPLNRHEQAGRENPGDEELVARVCRGDEAALSALYARYGALLYSVALRMVGDRTVCEEIVQDTFLTLWRRGDSYDGRRGQLGSWLVAIARNKAVDYLRRTGRMARPVPVNPSDPAVDGHLAASPDPSGQEDPSDKVWLNETVVRALHRLRPEESEVVRLAFFGGFTHQEIAEARKLPLGTVKSRMRTALQRLRSLMLEIGGDEFGQGSRGR